MTDDLLADHDELQNDEFQYFINDFPTELLEKPSIQSSIEGRDEEDFRMIVDFGLSI